MQWEEFTATLSVEQQQWLAAALKALEIEVATTTATMHRNGDLTDVRAHLNRVQDWLGDIPPLLK